MSEVSAESVNFIKNEGTCLRIETGATFRRHKNDLHIHVFLYLARTEPLNL